MASITIIDTGYISPTNTGTRTASGNMANGGTALTLKSMDFKPHTRSNVDNAPLLGVFATGTETSSGTDIAVTSVENVDFTISGTLNMTDSTDQASCVPLLQMAKTKWYKALYYASTSSDANGQLIYQLADDTFTAGEQTAFSIAAAYRHLHVIITDVQFTHSANNHNMVMYQMKGVVTKKRTSTI